MTTAKRFDGGEKELVEQDGNSLENCTNQCRSVTHGSMIYAIGTKGSDDEVINLWIQTCKNYARVKDEFGRSAIHTAATMGRTRVIHWLIKKCNVNVNSKQNEGGYTPLHLSIIFRQIDATRALVQLGANLTMTDSEGFTAFDLLISSNTEKQSNPVPGSVFVSGSNDNLTLGSGKLSEVPKDLLILPDWNIKIRKVLLQTYHSVFLTEKGQVCVTGTGSRLGIETQIAVDPVLVDFGLDTACIDIAAGPDHNIFLMKNGTVWSSGSNNNFVLGHENLGPVDSSKPRRITPLYHICSIAASSNHSVFATKNTVYVCGVNAGQLGKGIPHLSSIKQPKMVFRYDPVPEVDDCIVHVSCTDEATVVTSSTCIYLFYQNHIHPKVLREKEITAQFNEKFRITRAEVISGRNYKEQLAIFVLLEQSLSSEVCSSEILLCSFLKSTSNPNSNVYELPRKVICKVKFGMVICQFSFNFAVNNNEIFIVNRGAAYRGDLKNDEDSKDNNLKMKRILNVYYATQVFCDPKRANFAITQKFRVPLKLKNNYDLGVSRDGFLLGQHFFFDLDEKLSIPIWIAPSREIDGWFEKLSDPKKIFVVIKSNDLPEHDVELICSNGVKIGAHRDILIRKIDYFSAMFSASWTESTSPIATVNFQFTSTAAKWFFLLLYVGSLHLDAWDDKSGIKEEDQIVIEILKMVDMLDFCSLRNIAEKSLALRLNHRNAVDFLMIAYQYNAPNLMRYARGFICASLPYFIENRLLDHLNIDLIHHITSGLNDITSEMDRRKRTDLVNKLSPSSEAPPDDAYANVNSYVSIDELESLFKDEDFEDDMGRSVSCGQTTPQKTKPKGRTRKRTVSNPETNIDEETPETSIDEETLITQVDLSLNTTMSTMYKNVHSSPLNDNDIKTDSENWKKVDSAEKRRQKRNSSRSESEDLHTNSSKSPSKPLKTAEVFCEVPITPPLVNPRPQRKLGSNFSTPVSKETMKAQNQILRQDKPKFESLPLDFPTLDNTLSPKMVPKSTTIPKSIEIKGKKKVKWVSVSQPEKLESPPENCDTPPIPTAIPPNPWLSSPKAIQSPIVADFRKVIADEEKKKENYVKATKKSLKLLQIEDLAIEQFRAKFTTQEVIDGFEVLEIKRHEEGKSEYSEPVWAYEKKSSAVGGAATLDKLFVQAASSVENDRTSPKLTSSSSNSVPTRRQRSRSTNTEDS